MGSSFYPVRERKELKVRITKSLYERLMAECGECGCTMNAVVTLAIAREIAHRRQRRSEEANARILAGQIEMELKDDAQND